MPKGLSGGKLAAAIVVPVVVLTIAGVAFAVVGYPKYQFFSIFASIFGFRFSIFFFAFLSIYFRFISKINK
jgi:hypothetical protein